MQTQKLFILAFILGLFFSCEKERNTYVENPPAPASNSRYLMVGHEGAFGTNTASLSLIDLENNTVTNNVYQSKNLQALGDVLQSMTRIADFYYFVVNNSNKILITDTAFNKKAEIKNLTSPRYITAVSPTKAYVSSLFTNRLYIIDLVSNTKISEIQMRTNWTEQMVLINDGGGDAVYICENDTAINYITKIDVNTNQLVDSIPIAGYAPSQITRSSDGHLWVLAGNNFYGKQSTLTEVDPATKKIIRSFTFDKRFTTGQMALGPNDEKYVVVVDYATNEYGVYKFNKGAATMPATYFTTTPSGANFYGIAVNPTNGEVFISDSKGFSQAGAVYRYTPSGVLLNNWTTAIGPSSFHFIQ